jgi:type VI protein secretion system component VasK
VKQTTLLFIGLLWVIAALCAAFIVWRLRRLAAERADASQRAAAAFEELARLGAELRQRHADEQGEAEAALSPGERLQRRYPGSARGDAVR